jgi:pyruvate/2-oxoglutarate dehydrogenase complex dihydrolipoamide dehydrogenase (E3) component
MMVRGSGLAESMSRYLIDRIAAAPNIELMTQTEIVALKGAPNAGLETVRWRDHRMGAETEAPIRNVFLFVGADPATEWLQGCGVLMDKAGFVITGARLGEGENRPSSLESSVPGVFAVGDVRSGSVKRVGGAIGEGALFRSNPLAGRRAHVEGLHAFAQHSRCEPERLGVRRVSEKGRCLAPPPDLSHMWACRLLRSVAWPARHQALSCN